VIQFDLNIF